MLGKIFGILCLIAFLFAVLCGNLSQLGEAVLDGTAKAVQVLISLGGMMCFWCGILEVLRQAGLIQRLSRLLSPFLRLFFPEAWRKKEGIEEISANVSANLLGIGNAATPYALEAMEKLQRHNPCKDRASAEQITLAVLNTASFSLIPATLLALRRAAGSQSAGSVIIPIWITSSLCTLLTLLLTRIPSIHKGKPPKDEHRSPNSGHRGRRR